jgi:hypothetical protein
MSHPFNALPAKQRKPVFLVLLLVTLLLMLAMNYIGSPLVTGQAPYGIVSYELAGSLEQSAGILASWDAEARLHAAFSLGFDYVFMLFYSTTIGFACAWAAEILQLRGWPGSRWGLPLAWGQWLAAIFDAVENLALTIFLFGALASPWPQIARICALLKFALIFLGILYALYGFAASRVTKPAMRPV